MHTMNKHLSGINHHGTAISSAHSLILFQMRGVNYTLIHRIQENGITWAKYMANEVLFSPLTYPMTRSHCSLPCQVHWQASHQDINSSGITTTLRITPHAKDASVSRNHGRRGFFAAEQAISSCPIVIIWHQFESNALPCFRNSVTEATSQIADRDIRKVLSEEWGNSKKMHNFKGKIL